MKQWPDRGPATKGASICLRKAAADEPIFVLRAQDLAAPAVVRLWCALTVVLTHAVQRGQDPFKVLARCEQQLAEVIPSFSETVEPQKVTDAMDIAAQMECWPVRKVAD